MAIYHCSVQVISRGGGRSCIAAAAYRAGSELEDARQGLTHDYTRRHDVRDTFIMAPETAPVWMQDRQALWTAVDAAEKRKDAQTAREVNIALPCELTPNQQRAVVWEFVQTSFVHQGMVADVAIHEGHNEFEPNPHAHILLTTREVSAEGFGLKNRDWNAKELLVAWRNQWEFVCNEALTKHGHAERIDARSLANQGLDRLPTVHEGVAVRQMERRGIETERGNWNRVIREHQTAVVDLQTVRKEREALEQIRDRIRRAEIWREEAGWSVAQRKGVRKQEEQMGRVLTRQDIQTAYQRNQVLREQHRPVWQSAQQKIRDAQQTLSEAKQHQQHLAGRVEQGRKAQVVIQREFSGMRGLWARWRWKAWYQEQQQQMETGRAAERELATGQSQIPQLETQVAQAEKQWEQRQKEHQEFVIQERGLRALLQQAWTPEELQMQRQQSAQREQQRIRERNQGYER